MKELLILFLAVSMFALPKLGEIIRNRANTTERTIYTNRDHRGRFIRIQAPRHQVIVKYGNEIVGGFEI